MILRREGWWEMIKRAPLRRSPFFKRDRMARPYDFIAYPSLEGDNPFPNDDDDKAINAYMAYRDSNPQLFNFMGDWKDILHSREAYEPTEKVLDSLCDTTVTSSTKLSDIPRFEAIIKDFFRQEATRLNISDELLEWANVEPVMPNADIEAPQIEMNVEDNDEESFQIADDAEADILVPNASSTADIVPIDVGSPTTYDPWSNATITYKELDELCMGQARKRLVAAKARALEVEVAERKRRSELTLAINKYFDLHDIAESMNSREARLDQMPLDELEAMLRLCEDKFDSLKTKDMIKNALATVEVAYESWFPNGIPLGKTRSWTLDKSIPKQLQTALFDTRTVPGCAFRACLDKHHIHLPDEVTVLLEIFKIILKGSHISRRSDAKIEELEDMDQENDGQDDQDDSDADAELEMSSDSELRDV